MDERPVRWRIAALVAIAALPLLASDARGDYEETERRLKACGVDDALRTKIHAAIDRGVAFLVKRQAADGAFTEHSAARGAYAGPGVTLLCTLALRHAGTPPTVGPVAKAVACVFETSARREVEQRVYEAGLALMLLQAVPGHAMDARRIASALAGALDQNSGGWGYVTPGPLPGDRLSDSPPPFHGGSSNLSTSQFAALGLWAARRMGILVPPGVWAKHAMSLCRAQQEDGSWTYVQGDPAERGVTYPTGTFIGLANLLLARAALAEAPPFLRQRVEAAIARARAALARDTLDTLHGSGAAEDHGPLPSAMHLRGMGEYYRLYALEKACLFADVESFDAGRGTSPPRIGFRPSPMAERARVSWYAAGAAGLLAAQRDDGGWRNERMRASSEINTAFALLFLLRSPAVFHPTTPSEVDGRPPPAVTPTDPPAAMGG